MTKSGGAIRQSPTPQKANHHPRKTRFFSFVFPSFLLLAFFVVCLLLLALCDQIPFLSTLLLGCYWSWALPGLCSTVVVVVVVVVVAVVVIVVGVGVGVVVVVVGCCCCCCC